MRALMLLSLSVSACSTPILFHPDSNGGFHAEKTPSGVSYQVYVPRAAAAAPDKTWPVILFLHGGGEVGDDGVLPTQVGLGPVAWRSKGELPFIVVFPQAPKNTYWGMPDNNTRALAALDDAISRYHGDTTRVYLTGNSLGGYGTWFMGALYAERFAALVPICGGVRGRAPKGAPFAEFDNDARVREVVRRIGKTPVWAFHGAKDWLVPPAGTRELVAALKAQGGEVRFNEYPDLGHNAWDRAYAEPELFTWLAAQHR